ncbi:hypothetical protein NDI37_06540 [Funiculus sociatus GB2-A5]|uniref:Uncharacterized protein n=1 Tax=Funiculus sociatus GB2-A5 TaxID=2933946 RepID=A0ABV0JKZ9_9CYAN|nr:hypothetical protein [Trichocoleus sp. FACHB-6]MBD2065852.1 hypothetical protein [Trichocoleus sp. FACHB-6]
MSIYRKNPGTLSLEPYVKSTGYDSAESSRTCSRKAIPKRLQGKRSHPILNHRHN